MMGLPFLHTAGRRRGAWRAGPFSGANRASQLRLEMINLGPVPFMLRPAMPIAQLIVEEVKGIPFANPSQFHRQKSPEGID